MSRGSAGGDGSARPAEQATDTKRRIEAIAVYGNLMDNSPGTTRSCTSIRANA
jgi:hypothetical protein